ncbi:spliceosome ATPase-activating subunit SPP2 [Aspergillus melleus]|uniref:spliceosome ATPase-activating subunit SPP2 n=1 Tax=Aspergillus melleus TaxID=138277 RepID=UPI001E8DD055|nr:DNA primase large subunit Spp2 [Aspergillus melleus]KAH8428695.1 DNA primase large subunit Spp2 [Aspergillus melleus]
MSSSQPPQDGDRQSESSAKPFTMSIGGRAATSTANGSKKTSFNLQSTSRQPDTSKRNLPRRPHNLHDDDESDDDADSRAPAHEAVTGFDTMTGTAISADRSNEPRQLVIPVASNNNWRSRPGINTRPKGKNLLPKEVQAIREAEKRGEVAGENVETDRPSVSYGLSFAQATPQTEGVEGSDTATATNGDQTMEDADAEREPRKPLTQDEIAMNALIRESKGETEARSDLVIESAAADQDSRFDETTSFRADIASRPESASLDQYNAVPVEEFGAALLRGMGWKEGQSVGKGKYGSPSAGADKPRVPERRPGFLGIGAKDTSTGGKGAEAEFGAWGKAAMRKGSRKTGKEGENNTEGVYMPVLMQNKKTGSFMTEEELAAAKKEAKKQDNDDWKERRDRNLEKSGRDRDRDREYRRRDYDDEDDSDRYDRRRKGSSRRDRSRSSGDRHSRRKYDDREDDSDRREDRHRRDRDRDRDRRDRDRDRDRSHRYRDDDRYSSRHSSSTSSRHGRDRDRDSDRDSHRRRRYDD